jgi:hypothetical protein
MVLGTPELGQVSRRLPSWDHWSPEHSPPSLGRALCCHRVPVLPSVVWSHESVWGWTP